MRVTLDNLLRLSSVALHGGDRNRRSLVKGVDPEGMTSRSRAGPWSPSFLALCFLAAETEQLSSTVCCASLQA